MFGFISLYNSILDGFKMNNLKTLLVILVGTIIGFLLVVGATIGALVL